ncbi:hypothetical protein CYMTET_39962 [Cymbomonas tetramitiformis]|uniref:Uncharacterized protein n=1 Tax=Cymbomonas tetramitiformis TaxID=36881 RepID=A0AAE0F3Q8_9CHLO|nr:hypothetical protein CYMTET_39962 [Cymbomonas tetramitiformis]
MVYPRVYGHRIFFLALLASVTVEQVAGAGEYCERHPQCSETEYCSQRLDCRECSYCHIYLDPVDDVCPEHCPKQSPPPPSPPLGQSVCDSHVRCGDIEYCDQFKRCSPCKYCYNYNDGVNGECPSKCAIPPPPPHSPPPSPSPPPFPSPPPGDMCDGLKLSDRFCYECAKFIDPDTGGADFECFTPSIGDLESKKGCWHEGYCCAKSEGDCYESNVGAVVGVSIAAIVGFFGLIISLCACCSCCPLYPKLCCAPKRLQSAPMAQQQSNIDSAYY